MKVDHITYNHGLNEQSEQSQVTGSKDSKTNPVKQQPAQKLTIPLMVPGTQTRLNTVNTYEFPKNYSQRNKPQYLIGSIIRLSYLINNWENYVGHFVSVAGWAKQTRLAAKDTLLFIKLGDGSSSNTIQVVIEKTIPNWQEVHRAKIGYSFKFTGKIQKSEGKGQKFELKLKGSPEQKVIIYGKCDDDKYPLAGKQINLETLRDIAHLRPRTQIMSCVARIKNSLAYSTHQFFQNNGFLYIHTPVITAADCEGAGEMFQVTTLLPENGEIKDIPQVNGKIDYTKQFFKKKANLTVSGQLAVENFCCSLSNVYTFGPTFRAQVSHTSRHIAQFWMIEPQLAFADVYDTMQCAEAYVQYCIKFVLENNIDDLEFIQKKKKGHIEYLSKIVSGPFAKASYSEAVEILIKVVENGYVFPEGKNKIEWGMDFASQHQRYLCQHIFHKPVILYNYPKKIKAFYMRANDDGKTVASFDILAPQVGQIIGGSQRQQRLEVLEQKMEQQKLEKENYWWYLDLRRHGSVPHGGFGLGFERLAMMVAGIENIRDVSCFPRTPGNAEF